MSSPLRPLIALLALSLALPISAADPTPADARRAALIRAGYTPIPLIVDRQMFLNVEGKVGPEKVRFQLDTENVYTVLNLPVANRLAVELGERIQTTLLEGVRVYSEVEFPGLTLGSYDAFKDWDTVQRLTGDLSSLPSKPMGLLGLADLHLGAAVIDYPTRTLYMRPPLTTAWPHLAGIWTVTSWQEEEQLRKLDPKSPPTFAFADHRLKLTAGGKTREYAIRLALDDRDSTYQIALIDPKYKGKPGDVTLADGVIKVKGDKMTACMALDAKKREQSPIEFAAPKGSGYVLLELKYTGQDTRKSPLDPLRELLVKDGYTAIPMEQQQNGHFRRMVLAHFGQHALRLLVDTGANVTVLDKAGLKKWGGKRLGAQEAGGFGGRVKAEDTFRGLILGKYDTRRAWAAMYGAGLDLTECNKFLAEDKLPSLQGAVGNLELLTGSAVIDFGTNTLYLRPIKDTLWPQLQGKWTGVRYEMDGRKGPYKPGEAAIEFKDGRIRFTTKNAAAEWGFHLRDEGDKYRIGLFDPKADVLADGFKYASGGLLKLSGDKIMLLMEQGSVRKEPTEFAAPAGSGLLLVEYEQAIDAAKLIGKWNWVAKKGADPSVLEFRKDGTVQITTMSKEADLVLVGKYKIEGKKVVLIGEGRNYVYFINKFTDTEFSWTADEDKVTESYTRVKEK